MTVLSTAVYERDDDKIQEFKKEKEKETSNLIFESEDPIRNITAQFGLEFEGATELKSLNGPFCGLYWSEKHPMIIVAFKGTTPTNYSEFLVDASLQRTDARTYLFGSAHEGFYDSLFPTHMDDEDSKDPYFAIQIAVMQRAQKLQEIHGTDTKIHVWVTGHSLGAAMGCLLFARWLKCPEDIEPACILRDGYVIGTPAVGDSDFASMFASYSNMPLNRTSTLWRIINKSDIICRIPPGYNSSTIGHYAPTTDFFNYAHVGHAIQITHPILYTTPIKAYPSSYESNLKVVVVSGLWKGTWSSGSAKEEFKSSNTKINKYAKTADAGYSAWAKKTCKKLGLDPIGFIESLYPFFIRDHIPIHYFKGLEKAREFYIKIEKDHNKD